MTENASFFSRTPKKGTRLDFARRGFLVSLGSMTVGVEFEFQLVDPSTRDLQPASIEILQKLPTEIRPFVTAELFQSMIEVNSPVARHPGELRESLKSIVRGLREVALRCGVDMATGGTHPFANYVNRKTWPSTRYEELIDRNQWIARRLLIFGLHVHLSVRNDDEFFRLFNGLQWYLPLSLAVSGSSPYWKGEDTGLQSARMTFFEAIPTGGHPSHVDTLAEFDEMYQALLNAKAVRSHKDLWWDLRPSPKFGTIEIRMPDMSPRLEDNLRVAALIQTLAAGLLDGILVPPGPIVDWVVRENKWRTARHGMEADILTHRNGETMPAKEMLLGLIRRLEPVARRIGTHLELEEMKERIDELSSAERQRQAYSLRGDLRDVVDLLKSELTSSLDEH